MDFNLKFWPKVPSRQPLSTEDEAEITRQSKEFALLSAGEWDELLRRLRAKPHRSEGQLPINRSAVREDLIDVFKYWLSAFTAWGFRPKDLVEGFWHKSIKCRQRHTEEFLMSRDKIVVVDIDGVLCDFNVGFCNWIADVRPDVLKRCGKEWPDEHHFNHRSLGLEYEQYQQLKHEFRCSGAVGRLPAAYGSQELLALMRNWGVTIVLLTARPIDRYPNIYCDTLYWLQDNGLEFDALWYSSDKDEKVLAEGVLENIIMVIEDDTKHIKQFLEAGLNVVAYKNHAAYNELQGQYKDHIAFAGNHTALGVAATMMYIKHQKESSDAAS